MNNRRIKYPYISKAIDYHEFIDELNELPKNNEKDYLEIGVVFIDYYAVFYKKNNKPKKQECIKMLIEYIYPNDIISQFELLDKLSNYSQGDRISINDNFNLNNNFIDNVKKKIKSINEFCELNKTLNNDSKNFKRKKL